MDENSYGDAKRLAFLTEVIRDRRPQRVLDIGCGTGMKVTRPLAERFPDISVLGSDADRGSIAWAQSNNRDIANLAFADPDELPPQSRFDLVIASEVIEHVSDPYQFLLDLRARLMPGGSLVLTLPNGYGPFEMMALTECLLRLSGAQALLRRVKYAVLGRSLPVPPAELDTLAISPHVNFFSAGEIRRLFAAAGFAVAACANRTVLCGYLLDDVIRGKQLTRLNAALADRLPACLVSDWMFALRPATEWRAGEASPWQRGSWARFKKRLNERRWGLA